MRLREVEIHHADLALDYTAADWARGSSTSCWTPGHRVRQRRALVGARDGPRPLVTFGGGGPVVSGPASALAWW